MTDDRLPLERRAEVASQTQPLYDQSDRPRGAGLHGFDRGVLVEGSFVWVAPARSLSLP